MTKIVYIDEQAGWQSTVYAALSDKYDIYIPETMPRNVSDIWTEVRDSQVVIVDFRLNESGPVSYTGDDVAREIHKHNKHLPIFIIRFARFLASAKVLTSAPLPTFTSSKIISGSCLRIAFNQLS